MSVNPEIIGRDIRVNSKLMFEGVERGLASAVSEGAMLGERAGYHLEILRTAFREMDNEDIKNLILEMRNTDSPA